MTTIDTESDNESASPSIAADAPHAPMKQSRAKAIALNVVPPLLLGSVVVSLWYFVSYVMLDSARQFLLRPPHQVIDVGFLDGDNFSELMGGLRSSATVALYGLLIAIAIGFTIAILMSQAKVIERAVFPFMVTLQAIPILAIVPMIGFWFGFGAKSRIIVCVIIALFPIIVNTLFGLQSAERAMHDLFTLHHANRLTRLRKLMFPNALPAIFAGLRISAGLSVIGAIVGDFFFGRGEAGIGQLLRKYANQLSGEQLLAAVMVSSALGVTVFLTFGVIQDKAIGRWYSDTDGAKT